MAAGRRSKRRIDEIGWKAHPEGAMLKRALILFLGLWLIVASGLSAHAGPCSMDGATEEAGAGADPHADCPMMASEDAAEPAPADIPDRDGNCCCPAVLAGLPVAALPEAGKPVFAASASLPPDFRASSRASVPEPPPPKA
jgi:hypothetical protein